ncbi:hypothetical protein ACQEVZ_20220 [Dactylosporangium sp. CA-152071]|uniref:hypothetical protein n=1 Tax=Dactylosporangium sp. CA-152071 TaxID=3239933 RepID=UPI003D8C9D70
MTRPACPACSATVDRLQRSYGVVAAYPCSCWLTPAAAQQLVDEHRTRTTNPGSRTQ